jgi:hypothetical protein
LQNIARTITLLISEFIHNFDGHAEELSHFLKHRVSILSSDNFISPVVNSATDLLLHLLKIPNFKETLAEYLVNHAANLGLLIAWDVSPD